VLALQDRLAEPGVGGHDEVAQGLGEGPLAGDRGVDGAGRHTGCALERGRPGGFERRPGGAQPPRVGGRAQLAAGEAAAELSIDQRDDVDAVDEQAAAVFQEPRGVDLHAGDLAAADDDLAEVALDEPRRAQRAVGEGLTSESLGRSVSHGMTVPWCADSGATIRAQNCRCASP
jgi:hypothetical protein